MNIRSGLPFVLSMGLLLAGCGLPSQAAPPPPSHSIAPVIEKTVPAVVNISTQRLVGGKGRQLLIDPYTWQLYGYRDEPVKRKNHSLGSGVIIDAKKGWIITNHHVIDGADEVTVTLRDQRSFKAKVLGDDPAVDVALLQIEADGLSALELADSDQLRVGDFVVAIGNPFGLGQTVTYGIVSALGRTGLGIEGYENFIQTDASINPGNSGGALITTRGQLVGINTAIMGGAGGNIGIGFAIPSNMVKAIVSQLADYGQVQRGQIGVVMQDLDQELARAFGLKDHNGVVITQILPGSAAEKAGLKSGDVIVSVNGKKIRNGAAIRNMVGMMRAGTEVRMEVMRDGKLRKVKATIALPRDAQTQGRKIDPRFSGALLGHTKALNEANESGVAVLKVKRNSRAWEAGLRPGDVILSVNRQRVDSLLDLSSVVASAKTDGLLLNIRRGDSALFVIVR